MYICNPVQPECTVHGSCKEVFLVMQYVPGMYMSPVRWYKYMVYVCPQFLLHILFYKHFFCTKYLLGYTITFTAQQKSARQVHHRLNRGRGILQVAFTSKMRCKTHTSYRCIGEGSGRKFIMDLIGIVKDQVLLWLM